MDTIVIVGGGYGGLSVAHHLLEDEWVHHSSIILIDRMPYQGLKTEYYALAAGTVSDLDIRISYPVDPRLQLKYGEVTEVDLERKLVYLHGQDPVPYDRLVISLGCTDRYHGIPGADQYSNSIQTLSGTRKTYQHLNDVKPYGQVTIVGGGLSGVELASELRESRPDLNIRILDRGPSILSAFPRQLQRYAADWFVKHDVEMIPHFTLSRLEPGMLYYAEEQAPLLTDVTVWTAGIQPNVIVQKLNVPKDPQGRVLLNTNHQIAEYPQVYVVGDCASLPFSPSAQAAEAQGRQVAEIIGALARGTAPKPGRIRLKGMLGSLGKKSGFGLMGSHALIGRIPRILKSGVLWKFRRHFG